MPARTVWGSVSELLARLRSLYRGLRHRAVVERDMREEFQHHIAARTEDLIHQGLAPVAARRQAQREFGHQDTFRAESRVAMGLSPFAQIRFSWLDVRWALRTLRKHPTLNLAVIFALAVGIPVGLAPSHLARALNAPLPGDAEHRVRAIRHWDPLVSGVAATTVEDYTRWAQALGSFSALGAFRAVSVNVGAEDGRAAPASAALLSESVLQMLGAAPLLGRVFDAGDFAAEAPSVAVIGHGLWSERFARDPHVIGRTIRVGSGLHAVIGVMPEGFAFPSNEALWMPLRIATSAADPQSRVQIVGRLADGVTAEQAQRELLVHGPAPRGGVRTAREDEERARLRAEVVPFGLLYMGLPASGLAGLPEFRFVQVLMFLLLLVACGNVAVLTFARTATRLRELAIRTALGASRARIVVQLFLETFVLALVAAGVGVLVVDRALDYVNIAGIAGATALPYWLSLGLTRQTVASALALATVSATAAGVIPAIAITGRAIAQHIGGAARVRFGRLTGALVVADIAVSVAAVGMAFSVARHATDLTALRHATGVAAQEFLAVEFRLPEVGVSLAGAAVDDSAARRLRERLAADQRELVAALEREPGIRRAAVADALPRMEHRSRPFEVDGAARANDQRLRWTRVARVDVEYFGALKTPILAGRGFTSSDTNEGTRVAIVNSAFVERTLGGTDAIGRRVRFPALTGASDSAWYEIVGVIGPLGVNIVNAERGEAVYVPAAPGSLNPLQLAVHTSLPPATLIARVRELALQVNPELVMGTAAVLSDVRQGDWYLVMGLAAGLVVLAGVLVAMAASGLYAMLSLAVTERTREIGIRVALGAPRRALLLTILRRPLVQIGLGALIGLPLAARFVFELTATPEGGGSVIRSSAVALGLSAAIVATVGVASCLVPMRRILAIEASEAMRSDG
jgi:predicted permease